jgi:radical SAM/Cys-rich protein
MVEEQQYELDGLDAGPKPTTSLVRRRDALAEPAEQLRRLAAVDLSGLPGDGSFDRAMDNNGLGQLRPANLDIFQINVGRLCNMTCRHCHVDAGPDRIAENADRAALEHALTALDRSGAHTVDLTGGAPELNPHFRWLVDQCVARGLHVIDRCNLTVLLLQRCADLPEWLGARGVEIVASLPHHRRPNTDAQRGESTYDRSMQALRRLNEAGYGKGDPTRRLTLMTNPAGAFLPPSQASAEAEWKESLRRHQGVSFDRLIALTNMPIARFLEFLEEREQTDPYLQRVAGAFNPLAVAGLMCRNTLSVGWDGKVYDCDFNQMLELPAMVEGSEGPRPMTLADVGSEQANARRIVTARHCFGCTAGAGSSCGGATT